MRVLGIFPIFPLLFILLCCVSCVREDMEGCVRYELHVRAVDADGNDLTGNGVLQKSDIYLFNEQGFVRMIPSEGFSEFSFGEDRGERLTLVAWGNLKEDTLITTEIAPGTSLKDAKLQLRQYTHGTHIPITDLFYCRRERNRGDKHAGCGRNGYYARNGTYGGGPQYTHALSCRTLSL